MKYYKTPVKKGTSLFVIIPQTVRNYFDITTNTMLAVDVTLPPSSVLFHDYKCLSCNHIFSSLAEELECPNCHLKDEENFEIVNTVDIMKGGQTEMETQNDLLNIEIGTKEVSTLKPAKVKIVDVIVKKVGEKGNQKVSLSVKHPDREEVVEISTVKIENKGKLEFAGLWVNLDDDGLLRKGSLLAKSLDFFGVKSANQLKEKEVETVLDDKGYLAIKAY